MPRVHTATRKRKVVKRAMNCAGPCKLAAERGSTEILVGDSYYTWSRKLSRGGITYFKHVECGRPKPTQLSSRKTAVIDEAIGDANWPTPTFDANDSGLAENFLAEVKSVVEEIGSVIRDVGQEYQDSFDNMPEGLNQGDTGQALEAVAQEMEDKADELESWDPSSEEPDWPDTPDESDESDDAIDDERQQAFETWADDVLQEAQDAVSEYPEYQG
jgi:hypothetical protein